ncbi:MAG TPA: hypothetical protein VF055_14320, partial [Steroidobacteraceae bacterium]
MTVTLPSPFRSSRGLAQGNVLLDVPGVALEVVGLEVGAELYAGWLRRIECVASALGWPAPTFARRDAGAHHTLSFSAPADQLQTARAANEWALCASLLERDPCHWSALREALRASVAATTDADLARCRVAAEIDEGKVIDRLVQLGAAEAQAVPAAVSHGSRQTPSRRLSAAPSKRSRCGPRSAMPCKPDSSPRPGLTVTPRSASPCTTSGASFAASPATSVPRAI